MNLIPRLLKHSPFWVWILSFVVGLQCLAMAKPILLSDGSHTYRYLTKQIDLKQANEEAAEEAMTAIISGTATAEDYAIIESIDTEHDQSKQNLVLRLDQTWGYILLVIAVGTFLTHRRQRILACLLMLVSIWCFIDSMSALKNGGVAFSNLSPYGAGARIASPLILALFLFFSPKHTKADAHANAQTKPIPLHPALLNIIDWIARIGLMVTFASHGYKAYRIDFHFQDLINLTTRRIDIHFSECTLELLLKIIGIQDILLAIAILFLRSKLILAWIAAWGIITAFSRMTAMGFSWTEYTMVRAANGGLAIALIAFYCWRDLHILDGQPLGKKPFFCFHSIR